eukprot:942971-Prorocentrum_minimum.AAC.2
MEEARRLRHLAGEMASALRSYTFTKEGVVTARCVCDPGSQSTCRMYSSLEESPISSARRSITSPRALTVYTWHSRSPATARWAALIGQKATRHTSKPAAWRESGRTPMRSAVAAAAGGCEAASRGGASAVAGGGSLGAGEGAGPVVRAQEGDDIQQAHAIAIRHREVPAGGAGERGAPEGTACQLLAQVAAAAVVVLHLQVKRAGLEGAPQHH